MTPRRYARPLSIVAALALAATVAACGSHRTKAAAAPASSAAASGMSTAADTAFVLHMLPHHERAIAVGMLAETRGSDPRVRAFGQRIVTEQTPEKDKLAGFVRTLHLDPTPADAAMADGYITDDEFARLQSETGDAFDRDMLLLSARSETGAAAMAQAELAGGRYAPARALAAPIAGAPKSEIPQLRALAETFP